MANEQNLKPFTGVDDPRRQNGRSKGSKNLATIVRELENENFDWSQPYIKQKNLTGTPWRAIVAVALSQALDGNIFAAEWLRKASYGNGNAMVEKRDGVFYMEPVIIDNDRLDEVEEEIRQKDYISDRLYELTGKRPLIVSNITPRAR